MTTCACLWDSTRQPIAPEGRSLSGTCNQTKTFNKKGASPRWRSLSSHHKHLCGIRIPTQGDYRAANASSVRLEPPYGYHTASHRLGRLAID
jgi:hypothetical protein